jgi:magnesium transporter
MDETRYRIDAEMDQEEAAQLFEQYDLSFRRRGG